ncbi:extracellular aspartic proteinase [Niveomyces insectorum RCEF 264]|uniref:Extracellular aspartic proteinase n=1 Tax=Niveomyces insectorum RCEF 264 TaxID=1081102 RepID=A0A167Z518_9HYPO|nr:extracellular aspartic proteinase [Niveomyces insectorum RCEF 264]
MHFALNLVCLAGLVISFVWAAPTPGQLQKRSSFKVERVRNPNFAGHNGPRQLLKAYRKYGIRPPQPLLDRLNKEEAARKAAGNDRAGRKGGSDNNHDDETAGATNAAASGADFASLADAGAEEEDGLAGSIPSGSESAHAGSVANTPTAGDVEYLAPVTIGGQTLNLDFDTGSSDLWVFNTQMPQRQQAGHTLFDPAQSATFQPLPGQTFQITYGDGSGVAGTVGTDTVTIGGATVAQQAVELARQVSSAFVQDTSSDGLLGLAFSALNTVRPDQQQTFLDNVKDDLAAPVFTADLRHGTAGTYEFGAVDASKFAGALQVVPVDASQGFWQFTSATFAIGNGSVQPSASTSQAIADTGTTLLLANPNIVNAYYTGIPGAVDNEDIGGVTIPCDADLPDLQLDVGGRMATIRGRDIMFEPVDDDNTCFGGLQPLESDLMIFGDIFFKSNFVVFDAGNNTLGFAAHA